VKFLSFTVGPFQENTYLVIKGDEALLIDPGFSTNSEFVTMREALEASGAELKHILLTHAHIDHTLGLNVALHRYEVPVWLNHSDLTVWENSESQAAMFGIRAGGFSFTPRPLEELDSLELGSFTLTTLFTPGHSPDHISIYFKEAETLIAGDALFRESIGRTDLYGGDAGVLADSIREKLYTLPDETRVLPGHGPETTIGHEKVNNPFVTAG